MSDPPPDPQSTTQLHSIDTVAARLAVSRDTVRRLIAREDLIAIRIGGVLRVPATELEAFVERQRGAGT